MAVLDFECHTRTFVVMSVSDDELHATVMFRGTIVLGSWTVESVIDKIAVIDIDVRVGIGIGVTVGRCCENDRCRSPSWLSYGRKPR